VRRARKAVGGFAKGRPLAPEANVRGADGHVRALPTKKGEKRAHPSLMTRTLSGVLAIGIILLLVCLAIDGILLVLMILRTIKRWLRDGV